MFQAYNQVLGVNIPERFSSFQVLATMGSSRES